MPTVPVLHGTYGVVPGFGALSPVPVNLIIVGPHFHRLWKFGAYLFITLLVLL